MIVLLSNDCACIPRKIAIYAKLLLDIIFDVMSKYELHVMFTILILLHAQYSYTYIYIAYQLWIAYVVHSHI